MTTVSPAEVWYEYTARVVNSEGSSFDDSLPVQSITPSVDRDRVWLCEATIVCEWIEGRKWELLDPRRVSSPARVWWSVTQLTGDPDDPTIIGHLPPPDLNPAPLATMWVRTVERNWVDRTVTITVSGGERMMQDKTRNAPTTINTGATTIGELVEWHLDRVFSSYVLEYSDVMAEPLLAGDQQLMLQKESHWDALQEELDPYGARLADEWGLTWTADDRAQPGALVKLASYEGAPDADPIVYECTETISRDGDWADGVLVEFTQPDGTTVYQASSGGANTRGMIRTRDRKAPAQNIAQQIKTRAIRRGYDLEVVARCRLDLTPYDDLQVHTPEGVVSARIRSIEWRVAESAMTIRAQYGEPEEA